MIAVAFTYGALALATALLVGWAFRESGRAFDESRRELEELLGRPLTPAEVWALYR